MPYNFAADSFQTNKLCSTLSSSEFDFFDGNDKIVAFEAPFGGLIGQRRLFISDSLESSYWALISHNRTFFSLAPTVEPLRANIEWKSPFLNLSGAVRPKISGRRGRPPPTILCVRKTTRIYLSFGIRISAELSFVLSQFTRVTDRQTDGHLCRKKDRLHIAAR